MSLTVLFVYTVFAACFLGAIWRPILGVVGYLAVYMLYNRDVWWGFEVSRTILRPSYMAVLFLVAGCVLHAKDLNWKISRREKELYLFLGVAWLVSLAFGVGMHEESWNYLEKLTKIFAFLFLLIRVVHSVRDYKTVMWTLILGGVFLAQQAHVIGRFASGRLNNIGGIDFNEANGFASFLAFCVVMLGFWLLKTKMLQRILAVLGIALMLNAIIMTQSRAVFMGMALATPFVFLRTPVIHRKKILLYAALGIVLFLSLSDIKFLERMQTIKEQAELFRYQDSVAEEQLSRIDFWRASVRMFRDHPLGVGVKNFEKLVPFYDPRNTGMDAHNTYVLCYSELGIIGIVLFGVIIIEALLQLRRIRRLAFSTRIQDEIVMLGMALGTIYVIYLLGSMMTHSYLYTEFMWILLALPICLENAVRREIEDGAEAGAVAGQGQETANSIQS